MGDPDGRNGIRPEEAELWLCPPFEARRIPSTSAGMVPADVLRGDMPLCHWNAVASGSSSMLRNPPELAVESVPGAVNIPLPELRGRLKELPKTARSHYLPFRPACLLRDAHPFAERISKLGTSPEACCRVRCAL